MPSTKRGWAMIGRRPTRGVHKPRRWVPLREQAEFLVWSGAVRYTLRWYPRRGYVMTSWYRRGEYLDHPIKTPHMKGLVMKRRAVVGAAAPVRPPLSSDCVEMHHLPLIREFLSATSYEDGSARTPGYLWLTNRGTAYELVLFDPDAGARAPFLALTISEVFMAAELHLMAEEGAWQPDRYLQEQLSKKGKRKGS